MFLLTCFCALLLGPIWLRCETRSPSLRGKLDPDKRASPGGPPRFVSPHFELNLYYKTIARQKINFTLMSQTIENIFLFSVIFVSSVLLLLIFFNAKKDTFFSDQAGFTWWEFTFQCENSCKKKDKNHTVVFFYSVCNKWRWIAVLS